MAAFKITTKPNDVITFFVNVFNESSAVASLLGLVAIATSFLFRRP